MNHTRPTSHRVVLASAAFFAAAVTWLAACETVPNNENHPLSVRAATKNLDDLGPRVTGTLREARFRAVDVKVRVETMAGRERVDLLVSAERLQRCGVPRASRAARVWVRWKGTAPTDGTLGRLEPGQHGRMSVHYEVNEGGAWVAHSGGAAVVSLTKVFGGYTGRMWICFDDGLDSCVSGAFRAVECRSELDVDDSVWGAGRLEAQSPTKRTE